MESKKFTNTNNPKIFIWQGQWIGGAEQITLKVAEVLHDKYKQDVTLGVYKGKKNNHIEINQIEALPLFSTKIIGYSAVLSSLFLRWTGKLKSYDIVFSHTGGFWKTNSLFVQHEAADLDKYLQHLPIISKIYNYIAVKLNIISLKSADVVFAATQESKNFLSNHKISNIIRTSSFFDEKVFDTISYTQFDKHIFRILFVGRPDDKIKNYDNLFTAVKNMTQVHMTATGIYKKNLHISYTGWIDKSSVKQLLMNTHLLVLPSFYEGFPLTIIEALASGVPVLCTKNAVPYEILKYVNLTDYDADSIKSSIEKIRQNYKSVKNTAVKTAAQIRLMYNSSIVINDECQKLLKAWEAKKYY